MEEEEIEEEEVEELIKKLRTWKERVEYVLKNYPYARNDDFYLWLICVRLFCPEASKFIKFIPPRIFKRFPHFETIRRVRQKLQEKGKYLPTDPRVLKKRKKLYFLWKKAINEV